jgi:hypothetical protein
MKAAAEIPKSPRPASVHRRRLFCHQNLNSALSFASHPLLDTSRHVAQAEAICIRRGGRVAKGAMTAETCEDCHNKPSATNAWDVDHALQLVEFKLQPPITA